MTEKGSVRKNGISREHIDEGFIEYLSVCSDGGKHEWQQQKKAVRVESGGHAYVNECKKCFKLTRTPLST